MSIEKDKIVFPVGQKALIFEPTGADYESDFIANCKAVSETKPATIQDFFIRLAEMEKPNGTKAC